MKNYEKTQGAIPKNRYENQRKIGKSLKKQHAPPRLDLHAAKYAREPKWAQTDTVPS